MQRHEFTKEQMNGPKNVLGYPEFQRTQTHIEIAKPTHVIYESSTHKGLSTKKNK